jgi:hypothetical protein
MYRREGTGRYRGIPPRFGSQAKTIRLPVEYRHRGNADAQNRSQFPAPWCSRRRAATFGWVYENSSSRRHVTVSAQHHIAQLMVRGRD